MNELKVNGKKVLVVGFARTGQSVARYLASRGAKVTVTDTRSKSDFSEVMKEFEAHKFTYEFGKPNSKTFASSEMIVLSPGVPRSLPEIQEALQAGVEVISDLDIAASEMKAPIVAITGTNGKTTTTTMIAEMLKSSGKNVFIGGNIGTPVLDAVNQGLKPDVVVLEVSSFQCESISYLKPQVVVLTHLEPDHLDRYHSVEDYYAAKKRLISKLDNTCTLVLNHENAPSLKWADSTAAQVLYFTKKDPMKEPATQGGSFAEKFQGTYLKRPKLVSKIGNSEIIFDLMMTKLPGDHNRENFMAAICAARVMGATKEGIQKVINEFRGVSHRLEFIRRKDGVSFYNDSKGTNVGSVLRSIASFQAPIILIAGGRDKDQDFAPLVEPVKKRVKNLILVGESKEKLNRALGDFSETFLVGTFEEAVLLAYQKSRNGDVILFSPACASYDMFRNYEERGDFFRKLVAQL